MATAAIPDFRIDAATSCGEATFIDGTFSRDGKAIPVVIVAPRDREVGSGKKFVLRLIGGPGGDIRFERRDPMLRIAARLAADHGIGTVVIGYAGSASRSYFPDADLPEAIDDVRIVYESLLRVNGESRFCLQGESLGGYVALRALAESRGVFDRVSGLVVLNPLARSPASQFRFILSQPDGRRRLVYWDVNERKRNISGDEMIGIVTELRFEIFEKFFGGDWNTPGIEPGNFDGLYFRIFYSSHDDRGPGNVTYIERHAPPDALVRINTSQHDMTQSWLFPFYRGKIVKSIAQCLDSRPAV